MAQPEAAAPAAPKPPPAKMTIHLAAWNGDRAMVERFVREQEDMGYPAMETLQAKDGVTGDTPLHKAVENEQTALVQWLLEQGVMPNVKDSHGVTPLHVAAIKGYVALVQLLLDSDNTVKKVTDANGDTAVHWACTKGHLEVLDLLLARGAALDVANKQGWTALHRASFNGRPEVLERLLNAGASLHAVNQDGNTALHLAAHNNHLGAISLLLKWGSKTDMRNNEGLIPALCGQVPGVRSLIEEWEIAHPPKHKKIQIDKRQSPAKAASPRKLSSRERADATVEPSATVIEPSATVMDVKPAPVAVSVKAAPPSSNPTPRTSVTDGSSVPSRISYRRESHTSSHAGGMNPHPVRPGPPREGAGSDGKAWERVRSHFRERAVKEKDEAKKKIMARQTSGNKKFLQTYKLEKMGLFSP